MLEVSDLTISFIVIGSISFSIVIDLDAWIGNILYDERNLNVCFPAFDVDKVELKW
jgi:Trk-type K+ transport system membrane component